MDKELLKGCKNSTELLLRLIDHHGFVTDPIEVGLLQLTAYLAREKYSSRSNFDLCKRLLEELYPETKRLFIKPSSDTPNSSTLSMHAGEVAMIEYVQKQSDKKLAADAASKLLAEKYGTPKRLGSKYSEHRKSKEVRRLADDLLKLMEERGVSLDTLVESYLRHKN